jgi:hypothetical protein
MMDSFKVFIVFSGVHHAWRDAQFVETLMLKVSSGYEEYK